MCVEVHGDGASLDEAQEEFADLGRALTVLIALAANAPAEDAEWELAYEDTPGATSRGFKQRSVLTATDFPRPARLLDRALVAPVIKGLMGHAERERLHRAAVHYNEALKAWSPGRELRVVTHLWTAAEVLTPVALRRELDRTGRTKAELGRAWGVDSALDPEVRRRLIFAGDDATYAEAKKVSDAVEHGFEPFVDLHPRALAIREALALAVRRSIIDLADLPDELRRTLLEPPYAEPKTSFPMTRILPGRLVGEGARIAAEGHRHPVLQWTTDIASLVRTEEGSYEYRPRDILKPMFADGIALADIGMEVWGSQQNPVKVEPGAGFELLRVEDPDKGMER